MEGWTKNLLKCTTSHSSGDIGEIVIFSQTTVNRKCMGGKYQSIRWKDTFGFSIFWNIKSLDDLEPEPLKRFWKEVDDEWVAEK